MGNRGLKVLAAIAIVWVMGAVPTVRGELLEEIVASVNGDIITRNDLEVEEQQMLSEAYRRFTGDELDQQVELLQENLLVEMIDRKILLDRARAMFTDIEGVKEMYFDGFKQSQNINDDAEFARMLEQEGMTVEEFKQRLLEVYAPEEVLRVEVGNRISVSEGTVDRYYQEHPDQFAMEDEVTVREIVVLVESESDRSAKLTEAEAIVARVNNGEEFSSVAQDVSDAGTRAEGGLLGMVKRGHLSEQLEAIAFEIEEGQVSAPIETPYGYHILIVESRKVDAKASLEDVRENVRLFLEDQKYQEELTVFRAKMRREAEWCVRPRYTDRVPEAFAVEICEEM
jgi:parvulin-like peptidyl-prolyl isomerase